MGRRSTFPFEEEEDIPVLSLGFKNLFLRERWRSWKSSLKAKLNEKAVRTWCWKSKEEKSWYLLLSQWLSPRAALCVQEGSLKREESCSSSRVGRNVIALCFPLPKLQTLIVNIKGPAWPSRALEVHISPPPYLQLIPSNFPGAASFIYKLVGSTMFK